MSRRSPSGTSSPGDRLDRLQHRRALARQRRLLDLERRGDDQAAVRRDLVARLEGDDVAGHELLGRDVRALAAAADVRLDQQHLLERGDALGGLALLVQAEDRVEHGQADDHDAGRPLLQRDDADDRGAEQDELHQVAVLAEERLPARLLLPLRELVRPDLGAAPLDLGRVEARARARRRAAHASSAVRPCQPASRAVARGLGAGSALASRPPHSDLTRRSSAVRVFVCCSAAEVDPLLGQERARPLRPVECLGGRALRRELEHAGVVGIEPQLGGQLAARTPPASASASARRSGPRTERSSSSTPSGACIPKNARCSFEKSLRIERLPPTAHGRAPGRRRPSSSRSRRTRRASRRPRRRTPCSSARDPGDRPARPAGA